MLRVADLAEGALLGALCVERALLELLDLGAHARPVRGRSQDGGQADTGEEDAEGAHPAYSHVRFPNDHSSGSRPG